MPVAFAAPFVLFALAALPVLWWLLKVTPPRPVRTDFPPLRLLLALGRREETPARTPWWLTALRLVIAALVILAAAGPSWRAEPPLTAGTGPVWILLDNGHAAAPDFPARLATAEAAIAEAAADGRPVLLVATADGPPLRGRVSPADARDQLRTIAPRSWAPEHAAIAEALAALPDEAAPGTVLWIAEPAGDGSAAAFAERLAGLAGPAPVTVAGHDSPAPAALSRVESGPEGLTVTLRQAEPAETPLAVTIRALDRRGRVIDQVPATLAAGEAAARVALKMPVELLNEVARLEIADGRSAAGVRLVDDRWRRRSVGLIATAAGDRDQPLLSPAYYLTRALAPFADVRQARASGVDDAVAELVADRVAAIVIADVGTLGASSIEALTAFVEKGGVLIRFAGPRLAAGDDPLVPVPLRRGGRTLGGALSWDEPQALADYAAHGPFADLAVPGDVTVTRQVLAEPTPDLAVHTYASLADGTPLVTGAPNGLGQVMLFHVTADTSWSNLPLSGAFVDLLRRSVALGRAADGAGGAGRIAGVPTLAPLAVLDGEGRLQAPPPGLKGLAPASAAAALSSRAVPAGLYGVEDAFRAVNVLGGETLYRRTDLAALDGGARLVALRLGSGIDLAGSLLSAAILLLLADLLAVMALSGRLPGQAGAAPRIAAFALLSAGLAALSPPPATAADTEVDQRILEAVDVTRLAFVETGNAEIDEASRLGLAALSRFMAGRTSLTPGDPVAVDPERDELAVYPLIYWPIDPAAAAPSPDAMRRIDAFMKGGGTVLFDTRDQLAGVTGAEDAAGRRLREMLGGLDIPPLEPVPADHVLTKAFYLLDDFPGRFADGPLWVEALAEPEAPDPSRPVRGGDGVSPIIVTGNDLAGAWAADDAGSFLYPVVPGAPRQREFAFRVGVNIVMYTLTGNYKADQVHVPDLLERLGQ